MTTRTTLLASICVTLALAVALVGWGSGVPLQTDTGVTNQQSAVGTVKSFSGGTGLKITPLTRSPEGRFISESLVLKVTGPLMKMFDGKIRSVMLVSVSNLVHNSYVDLGSSAMTRGDPHFKANENRVKDIPCYLVTIEGETNAIPVLSTPNGEPGPGPSTVQVLVDATNGRVLDTMEFPYSNRSEPISIGTISILKINN